MSTTILPGDPAFQYSPGNWAIEGGTARSLNPGAYFRIAFTGAACTLHFDTSALSGNPPQVVFSIDGQPRVAAEVAPVLACPMPPDTADWPSHQLQLWFKSMGRGVVRHPGAATTLCFAGLALADGSAVSRPVAREASVLVMGDSITEGVLARNPAAAADTDQDDALLGYASLLGDHLGMEVGVIGFSGQGLTIAGDGGIPPFPAFFDVIVPGTSRTFRPEPTLILINQGTNDGVKTKNRLAATRQLLGVLRALLAATVETRIVVVQNFGNYLTRYLQAAVLAANDPRCSFLRTDGLVAGPDFVDGYHPGGGASLITVAPALANRLRPLLTAAPRVRPNGWWSGWRRRGAEGRQTLRRPRI